MEYSKSDFKIGDEVEFSDEWLNLVHGNNFKGQRRGVVSKLGKDEIISVIFHGRKTPCGYHSSFLKPINKD